MREAESVSGRLPAAVVLAGWQRPSFVSGRELRLQVRLRDPMVSQGATPSGASFEGDSPQTDEVQSG